jgi:hypothetical protein
MKRIVPTPRDLVVDRSGGRCEAMTTVSGLDVWTRCFRSPIEVHHRLTRARGGDLLDELGETYHLIALCPQHHREDADGGLAYESGLLLDGRMYKSGGLYWYEGSDDYLKDNYEQGVRLG